MKRASNSPEGQETPPSPPSLEAAAELRSYFCEGAGITIVYQCLSCNGQIAKLFLRLRPGQTLSPARVLLPQRDVRQNIRGQTSPTLDG